MIYSGDHNQPNDAAGYIDRILRHADSIGIRIRRGLTRCPAARFRHSDHGSCGASRTCFDHHCRNRGCAGLEEDSAAQRGLACALNSAGHPARLLLTSSHQRLVKGALGVLLIAFSVYSLIGRTPLELKRDNRVWLWVCGFCAGVLGEAYGMNGPPLVVYGAMRRWSAQHFRATLQGYFLPASLMGMAGYWFAGLWVPAVTHYYLVALPATLVAVFWGRVINHRLHAKLS